MRPNLCVGMVDKIGVVVVMVVAIRVVVIEVVVLMVVEIRVVVIEMVVLMVVDIRVVVIDAVVLNVPAIQLILVWIRVRKVIRVVTMMLVTMMVMREL